MNVLSVEAINAVSPYCVYKTEDTGLYRFTSDSDIEFIVGFEPDDLILSDETYQFVITNVDNRKSPRDDKIRKTILAIVEEFFSKNQVSLLYICESGDGKQAMRERLFEYWFETYRDNERFEMLTASVKDEDGMDNFAALILRRDNPNFARVVSEFTVSVELLNNKPE